MTNLQIIIDGKPALFAQVWVHLRTRSALGSTCRIEVPIDATKLIFDPYSTKPDHDAWKDFLWHEVNTFGTVMVEQYLKKMAQMRGERHTPRLWVLTTISQIEESQTGVLLSGTVEGFRRHSILPKELT